MNKHYCHWPSCETPVPPKMWGCKKHWFALPKHFRDRIWETYVPGQEITKTPSDEYLSVAAEIQEWIADCETAKQLEKLGVPADEADEVVDFLNDAIKR